jgi:chitodextrinase
MEMSVRRTALAFTILALTVVVDASAARPPQDRGAPSAPRNLRITATGPTSLSLQWDASSTKSSNWWYCLQRDGLGCIRVDPPQTTFTFSRLWPNATFNYSVVAIDANGNRSASSNTVSYTTPADLTPPTAPTLSTAAVFPTRVSLSWTQSVDNATQVSYTLFVDGSPYFSNQIGPNSSVVLGLQPSSTHSFKVVVTDYFGNSAESNTLSVTTPATTDTVAPTVPQNLRLSSESSIPEIWLAWDPSTDDNDQQGDISYEVFLNGELDHVAIGYVEDITYCKGEGPNTISVRAVDTSGNASAFSNEIMFC